MPEVVGGMARYDVNDPADAQVLVTNGKAWRSGPKTLQVIVRHIVDGTVTRNPARETPEVTTYLDKVAPLPSTPVESNDEPDPYDEDENERGAYPEPVEPPVE